MRICSRTLMLCIYGCARAFDLPTFRGGSTPISAVAARLGIMLPLFLPTLVCVCVCAIQLAETYSSSYLFTAGTTAIYDRLSVTWSDSIDGPWDKAAKGTRTYISEGAGSGGTPGFSPEDPFVWRDDKGRFHMLINSNSGHSNCAAKVPCGGHLWSEDGLEWSKPHTPAFGTIVHQSDGTTSVYDYCERPQIAQKPDGTPLTFYFGHGYSNVENVALMFCQDGDTDEDCVTTVQ